MNRPSHSLYFITPGELATTLGRLTADLRVVIRALRWDATARASRVIAEWPPGTAPDASTEHPGVLLFLPEGAVPPAKDEPEDPSRAGPVMHLPLFGQGVLLGCRLDVHSDASTSSMLALTEQLRRGLASDLTAPTWVWDLDRPEQTAMAHAEIAHSAVARTLYSQGWVWRQRSVHNLRYGPSAPSG